MQRSRLVVLGSVVMGMTVTGLFAETTATEGRSSGTVAQEGPLESSTIESHMGGAIVQGGVGGGSGGMMMGGGGGGMMMAGNRAPRRLARVSWWCRPPRPSRRPSQPFPRTCR